MRLFRSTFFRLMGVLIWVALARTTAAQPDVPVMEIESPTFDFGQVTEGDTVKHDFKVFNGGTAPLEIMKVKPG